MNDFAFAMMMKASLYITNNFLVESKTKSLNTKKIKFHNNQLLDELDNYLGVFMSKLSDEESKHFALVTDTLQTFINTLNTKDCKVVLALLMEYQNGNLMEIDPQKHGKIVKQLNKI